MKEKLFMSMLLAFAFSGMARAQDLVVKNDGGQIKQYAVSDILSIRFRNEALIVRFRDHTESEPLSLGSVLRFHSGLTGINAISASHGDQEVETRFDGTVLQVSPLRNSVNIAIYNLQGSAVLQQANWKGGSVDLGSLPSGVYIIRLGQKVLKVNKR